MLKRELPCKIFKDCYGEGYTKLVGHGCGHIYKIVDEPFTNDEVEGMWWVICCSVGPMISHEHGRWMAVLQAPKIAKRGKSSPYLLGS